MASIATHPYQDTFDGLSRWLRARREDSLPGETARQLLSYDHPGHAHLVGVTHLAESVYYYHCADRYVIAVALRSDGLDDGGPVIASLSDGPGIDAWVDDRDDALGWRHPRYR